MSHDSVDRAYIEGLRQKTLFDRIRDPWVRQHADMWLANRFEVLAATIGGYRVALWEHGLGDRDAMNGFEEWMWLRKDVANDIGWTGYITNQHDTEPDRINAFFALFDEFEEEVHEIGVDALREELRVYQLERYGFVVPVSLENE